MSSAIAFGEKATGLCNACGIPLDSQYFDDSSVQPTPGPGQEVVLARFDLPAQYCGVLQYFAQFTEAFAKDASKIDTPEIEWKLLVNNHELFPYINLRHIVNPWGYGSYPVNIRLDENSSIELVARGLVVQTDPVPNVAGRIMGRFWYNASYGGVEHGSY
jgi:hypothetical protein